MLPMEHKEARNCSHATSNGLKEDERLAKDAAEHSKFDDFADVAVLLICLLGPGLCWCQPQQENPAKHPSFVNKEWWLAQFWEHCKKC